MFHISPFCPTWLSNTSPICLIGCVMLSPVSTIPGCSVFTKLKNHSTWFVICLTVQNQLTRPLSVLWYVLPSSLPCASSQVRGQFGLGLLSQRSGIGDVYPRLLSSIRLCPNQHAFSNTRFLYGPSDHSTSSLMP